LDLFTDTFIYIDKVIYFFVYTLQLKFELRILKLKYDCLLINKTKGTYNLIYNL